MPAERKQGGSAANRGAAASFYRGVRFHLDGAERTWDDPDHWREFCGHAWSAFYLLEEAERHRFGGRYRCLKQK